jgi:hypothetical protein
MVKQIAGALALVVLMVVATGCARNGEIIRMVGDQDQRAFPDVPGEGPIPLDYADLSLVFSLKTHRPGIYPFGKDSHGTPDLTLLLNIDGRAASIKGMPRLETSEAQRLRDPEAGEGVRYIFKKDVRLKAGVHRLFVALPEDGVAMEQVVTLAAGKGHLLVLEPVYGGTRGTQGPGSYGMTSFYEGVKGLRGTLNGKPLQ